MANRNLVENLFESIRLCRSSKYNIYLIGSRLWGTNTKTSDWDLLIVSQLTMKEQLSNVHKCQYDVKLMDQQQFIEQVKEGSIIEVICYLLNKQEMIEHSFDFQSIEINLDKVNSWLNQRQNKDLEKAKKFWIKSNRKSAWKILRHILHSRAIYNYLQQQNIHDQHFNLTIEQIQTILQPATLLCQQDWISLEWNQLLPLFNQAFNQLQNTT